MSDPFLTELWAVADPPWNRLGPEIAAKIVVGNLAPLKPRIISALKDDRLKRWGKILQAERGRRVLTTGEAMRGAGLPATTEVLRAERGIATAGARAWAKLAAFYGITLE